MLARNISSYALKGLAITGLWLSAPASAWSAEEGRAAGIKGGHETKMCEWPTTVWLRNCTATLIHPRVAIYAAHCGSRIKSLFFGEHSRSEGSISPKVKFCRTNPQYTGSSSLGKGVDYAFCLLEEPMNDMPIAPIGYGCELEHVNPDNPVWLVGFGLNDNKEGKPTSGVKRMVKTNIGRHSDDGTEIELGRLGFVSSSGDSGGPAYVKLSDGTWRTVGITSWGAGPGPNWYVSAAHAVPWIHKVLKEEGYEDIDITPCYEDDGTWAPSTQCGGFALDPGKAYGSYAEQCAVGAPLSGPSSICGKANPKAKGGAKVPEVKIRSPRSEQEFSEEEAILVEVEVANVDKGASPEVSLLLSGDVQGTLKQKPYRWMLKELAQGKHNLRAKVVLPKTGSSDESEPLTIRVIAAKPDDSQKSSSSPGGTSNNNDPLPSDSQGSSQGITSNSNEGPAASGQDKDAQEREGCAVDRGRPAREVSCFWLLVLAAPRRALKSALAKLGPNPKAAGPRDSRLGRKL